MSQSRTPVEEAIESAKQAIDQLTKALCVLNATRPRDLLGLPTIKDEVTEMRAEGLRIVYDDLKHSYNNVAEIRDYFLKLELYRLEQ